MALMYCKNQSLRGVGIHIAGVYPHCSECQKYRQLNPIPKKRRYKHKMFKNIPKSKTNMISSILKGKVGITGDDRWVNQSDQQHFNSLHKK